MSECLDCHDTCVVFVGCCSGSMCGCMGYPVAAKPCKCGTQVNESKMDNTEKFMLEHIEWLGETK